MEKNKVALFTHEYPPMHGGVGVSSQRIAKLICSIGYNVDVFLIHPSSQMLLLDEGIEEIKDENIVVRKILVSSFNFKNNEATLRDDSYEKVRTSQEAFMKCSRIFEREEYNLILGLFISNIGQLTSLLSKKFNIPLLVSIRGNDIGKQVFNTSQLPKLRMTLENANYVTSVNDELLTIANSIVDIRDKSTVIHNSIDTNKISVKELDDKEELIVGSLGIFRFKKAMPYLFKALASLKENYNFKILLVGDYQNDEEKEIHEYYIQKYDLEDLIEITGLVDQREKFKYYHKFDIFILPSLFSEGCPSTLLEAMSVGLPIIASDAGAIPEILEHNKTGLIFKSGDSKELKDCLEFLIKNYDTRKSLANNAREEVLKLTYEAESKKWKEAIEKTIQNFV